MAEKREYTREGRENRDREGYVKIPMISPSKLDNAQTGFVRGMRRRKGCPLSGDNAPTIDYKDIRLLQRYTTERGKIIPSRISGVSVKKQRELAQAIKRARYMALMPYATA